MLHIFRIYKTILYTVVSWLLQMLWKIIDVQNSLSKKMTMKKVDGWTRRSVAELENSSQDLVLKDVQ